MYIFDIVSACLVLAVFAMWRSISQKPVIAFLIVLFAVPLLFDILEMPARLNNLVSCVAAIIAMAIGHNTAKHPVTGMAIAVILVFPLFLSVAWFITNMFTGNGIDESAVFHLTVGMEGAGYGQFATEIVLGAVCVGLLFGLIIIYYRILMCSGEDANTVYKMTNKIGRTTMAMILVVLSVSINPSEGELDNKWHGCLAMRYSFGFTCFQERVARHSKLFVRSHLYGGCIAGK